MDRRLTELCEAIADADAEGEKRFRAAGSRSGFAADASPPRLAGFARRRSPASTPTATCRQLPPAHRRARRDRPRRARPRPRLRARADPPARPRLGREPSGDRSPRVSEPTTAERGELLWEPSAEAIERSNLTRYMRWLERRARPRLRRRLRRALALVGRRARRLLGLDLGLLRRPRRRRPYERVLGRPRDARRRVVPRRPPQLRRAHLAGKPDDAARGPARLRAARARRAHLGRAPRAGRARSPPACARSASSAATASSPTCRTSPRRSSPSSPRRRSARSGRRCSPDFGARSVVDRFAQIEPKVLFAVDGYRYNGKRLRPHGRRRRALEPRCRRSSTRSSSPTSTPSADTGAPRAARSASAELLEAGRRRRARVRARPLRPPALGPLLLGHDRAAEGDRPGPRRDPARAAEEAPPPPRRAGGRPRLLVHHDRLDDVELPRRRPAHRGVDRPLRRQPGPPRHGRALGPRRARPRSPASAPRASYIAACMKAGVEPGLGPRPLARCARSARPARRWRPRASSGSTTTSAPTPGSSRPPAAPTSAPPSSAACRPCPSTAASFRAARSAARSRPGTRTATPLIDEVGELVITEPMPSMPRLLLGRRGRRALPRQLLRDVPRHLAPRRLDRDHLARHGDHLRPLRLDDQPLRRPHGHERDLPRRRLDRRDHRRARRRRPPPGHRGLDAAVRRPARGRRARRRADRARSRAGSASTARRATSRTRSTRSPRSRGRSAARCSRSP